MPIDGFERECLAGLGLRETDVDLIERVVRRGRGILFFCGPDGTGRRSAMYSLLAALNSDTHSLAALERDTRHPLPGVSHTTLEAQDRLADWLLKVAGADPDVLLLGELEGPSDMSSVLRVAGRCVVLIGSNRQWSLAPLQELVALGAPPSVICRIVSCVVSTRLVPRLCPYCRRPGARRDPLAAGFAWLQNQVMEGDAFEAPGCDRCDRTGRRGVVGLYEVREVGPQLEALLAGDYSPERLEAAGRCTTLLGLMEDALPKVHAGLLDLRDLAPLLDECPRTSETIPFWTN
jgi:type II secretory ATPase GspE/PulE/Tfp pilus assembly ATPase PilB-like protein